jgi:osmotically-inducible protein OsmY
MQKNQHHHRSSYYSISGVEFEGEDLAQFGKHSELVESNDELIKKEILQMFNSNPDIDPSSIEIEMDDGCAILKGRVKNTLMKRAAMLTAKSIDGVKEVVNQLLVTDSQEEGGREEFEAKLD